MAFAPALRAALATAGIGLALLAAAPGAVAQPLDPQRAAALAARVLELEEELRRLRGRVEALEADRDRLRDRLEQLERAAEPPRAAAPAEP
ncbi:MAG: hypothetical protein RMK81_15780, partial [Geminicoccaceae bacterium]|nr:hypothetical protein [Geminicoccaceae bacterium]